MMLLKCGTQYVSKFGNFSRGHRTEKGQFSFQSPRKGNAKQCLNYHSMAFISHASKIMLKIIQGRLQQLIKNFQTYKLDLEKAEEPEIKLPISVGS